MPGRDIEEFITRWSPSGGGECSNYQLFLSELCELLDVPQPDPADPDDTRNAYVCFERFPFPSPDEATRARIRALGEQLDTHRKQQQALHPGLTLTGMYNVLEKLRAIEKRAAPNAFGADLTSSSVSVAIEQSDSDHQPRVAEKSELPAGSRKHVGRLTAKENQIHEQGLVSVLKQIHDDLDPAVFQTYGWPATLTNEEILERLVALRMAT